MLLGLSLFPLQGRAWPLEEWKRWKGCACHVHFTGFFMFLSTYSLWCTALFCCVLICPYVITATVAIMTSWPWKMPISGEQKDTSTRCYSKRIFAPSWRLHGGNYEGYLCDVESPLILPMVLSFTVGIGIATVFALNLWELVGAWEHRNEGGRWVGLSLLQKVVWPFM